MDFAIVRFCNQLGLGTIDPETNLICDIRLLIALWTCLALAALVFDKSHGRQVFATVLVAIGLHFVISEGILKHALLTVVPLRERPYLAHPDAIVPVGFPFTDSSFPSSHCASTAAVLTVFAHFYRRALPASVGFCVVMCFSRMHNGMHYPTDVLTGSILGVAYGLAAIRIVKELDARRALQR